MPLYKQDASADKLATPSDLRIEGHDHIATCRNSAASFHIIYKRAYTRLESEMLLMSLPVVLYVDDVTERT